ncbi:hypothetical protein ACLOJK_014666 [Asimina triloba]
MLFFKSRVLSSLNRIAVSLVKSAVRREKDDCPESGMDWGVCTNKGPSIETEALRVRVTDPDAGEESSRTRETELETLQAECLQMASTHGGDALSSGSISTSTHAPVVTEYLRSNIHWQRKEFEHSNHSRSGYGKALSDVILLFPGIDLSSFYQKR